MKGRILIFGTTALAVLLSPSVLAQSLVESNVGALASDHEPTDELTWTVGLGVAGTPDYEGGDDYEAVPIPILRAQKGHRFGELIGLHVTSNLVDSKYWSFGPSLNYREGYSDVDNSRVDSLNNRGGSTEIGFKLGFAFPLQGKASLELAFEALADISGGHDGGLFTPSVEYRRPLGSRWILGVGTSTTYAEGNYMSHYFSINKRDARGTGLDEYEADRDFKDAELHVSLSWEWTEHWDVHGIAQYKRMLGDAEDSPIVDDVGDENQYFGGVALTYTWN